MNEELKPIEEYAEKINGFQHVSYSIKDEDVDIDATYGGSKKIRIKPFSFFKRDKIKRLLEKSSSATEAELKELYRIKDSFFNNKDFKEYNKASENEREKLFKKLQASIENGNNEPIIDITLDELDQLAYDQSLKNLNESFKNEIDKDLKGYNPYNSKVGNKGKRFFLKRIAKKREMDRIISNLKAELSGSKKENIKFQEQFLKKMFKTHDLNFSNSKTSTEEMLKICLEWQEELEIVDKKLERELKENGFYTDETLRERREDWAYYNWNMKLLIKKKQEDIIKEYFTILRDNNPVPLDSERLACKFGDKEFIINLYSVLDDLKEFAVMVKNVDKIKILQANNPVPLDKKRLSCKIGDEEFIINMDNFSSDLDDFILALKENENKKDDAKTTNVDKEKLNEKVSVENDFGSSGVASDKNLVDEEYEDNIATDSSNNEEAIDNGFSYEDTQMYIEFLKAYGGYSEEEAKLFATVPENLAWFDEQGFSWSKYIESFKSGKQKTSISYADFVYNAVKKYVVSSLMQENVYHNDNEFQNDNGHLVDLSGYDTSPFEFDFEEPSSTYVPKR